VIRSEPAGYWLDPRPYLAVLLSICEELPPGTRAFAESPGHYDFSSTECIKDLHLFVCGAGGPDFAVTVRFAANEWKHERGLALTYRNVITLTLDPETESVGLHGSVPLGELLPSRSGFEHEVALTEGVLRVAAEDLDAEWV
ncbi:hypothetical protein Q9S36_36480, partial [Microbacterium sp. ARD31]|uniref:hypothetical protein n=1 Tax=Microbacterium sp. ARD31 TaxID=2962576 RepID=UPI002880DA82